MVQKNQKWEKVLELFFEYPDKNFTIREISKKTKVPTSTIQRYLKELRNKGFIDENNRAIISSYYKFKKTFFMIDKMYTIGLIDFLNQEFNPSVMIVFGSVRKGEYDEESDIDIFLETSIKKNLNLKKYENLLKHKVQLRVESDIDNLPLNLKNNVINGIKLKGYLKVR